MRKCLYVIFLIAFAVSLSSALDVDTIFIWDNDRGKSIQKRVGVGLTGDNSGEGYAVWQDSRWGDFDVFGQAFNSERMLVGPNFMVSEDDFNEYSQKNADIAGNLIHSYIAVWEDSMYRPDEKPSKIFAAFKGDKPWLVYEHELSQKWPAVSSRANGWFAVCWTSYQGYPEPSILCNIYDTDGGFVHQNEVVPHDSITAYVPESRVVFCDEGGMVAYEDYSRDGTEYSIFGQFFDRDGNIKDNRAKLSRISGDGKDERDPDIAVNENGRMVVVWEDYHVDANGDIYVQILQAQGDHFSYVGTEFPIATGSQLQCNPRVAVVPDNSFIVVWEEDLDGSYDVWYQVWISGELYPRERIPKLNANRQEEPNIAARWGGLVDMVWTTWAYNNYPDVCLRHFKYNSGAQTGLDSLSGDIPLVAVNPDTGVGGRKCWYFDDENYDNPATAWNEDPIDEPDSVYVDLDFAMVDQIMELNTNGQYFLVNEDTLPTREQEALLTAYDAVFLDLGYRTTLSTAGLITSEEQNTLVDYIDPLSGDGKPAMVDGNDFGYMYDGTDFFKLFGAEYKGDGAPYTEGNIDTIFGIEGVFSENETLMYDYKGMVDNYIDSLDALPPAKILLYSSGAPTDWMAGRAVFWGSYWKSRDPGSTIYNSFIPAGITSTTHPHTYAEYYRRCLGFLGLNCQPEPITTLQAHIDTTETPEGRVVMKWQVVSDDSLRESAAGPHKLKFAREKMTSESAFDDAEEYYQTWNTGDSIVGDWVTESLYGLPPMDTLVFALKVSDESGLWNALGAEPQVIVGGDAVTPHNIVIGDNYVKDFSNAYELLHVDTRGFYDSLFVTWDSDSLYIGFSRCTFQTAGDLLIYFDVGAGGPDSTCPYYGLSGRSYFSADAGIFFPDYCLIIENSSTSRFYEGTATDGRLDTWVLRTFHGSYSEDNIVNGYLYTEISIPFTDIGYNTSNPFKLIVTVQNELSNTITNIYPIFNPIGAGAKITQYYYWSALGDDMIPNQTVQVIGIEEETEISDLELMGKALLITPNPFSSTTKILFSVTGWADIAEIRIFDITGRLVKRFEFENLQTQINQISWDGTDELGRKLPGGVYFCEFASGDKTEIEKAIFIR
ncbi:MAG: FlgD immunoglobulin-like domain containing protein [bacterium]